VRLTADGEALLARVGPLLVGLGEALGAAPDRVEAPSGEVHVATTPDLGRALLAPALVGFRQRFSSVRVKVSLSHELVDLLRDGVDLALRVGRPGGDSFVARKVGELSAGFFAAPSYLARRGVPQRIEQMAAHDGLWPTPPKGQRSFAFGRAAPPPPAVECADFGLLAECARAGGGVALLPTLLAARDVATGALVRVLPEFSPGGAPLYLVSRQVRPAAPRVTALRAFLLEALRGAGPR
jgi:DNA-binding transcriptional LysR family regulator